MPLSPLVDRLRAKRLEVGASQSLFARFLGCSLLAYWRWENQIHAPSLIFQKKILDLLEAVETIQAQKRGNQ